jgi:putrescine transport system permease protein
MMRALLRGQWFLPMALGAGLVFLYGPILSVIVYSFNESRLVTVWSGFSTKWYGALLHNDQILRAASLSIEVALMSATGALIIGTLAGFILARFRRFPTRTLFAGMVSAPLVMPEVIMGISTLLLFIGMEQVVGWPAGRGIETITIAHITFTMAFVAVMVQARLSDMDPSVEEAAMDLGARPVEVFFLITLPLIAPALAAGWLLAFSLSLDDFVITSFVSGPGSTTLPLLIFSRVRLGLSPEINALATVMIAIVSLATLVAALFQARKSGGG